MIDGGYISTADTTKAIRLALREAFPGVKFSVRSSVYSGGSSIRIGWTDGPTEKAVNAVAGVFSSSGFDGSIDLAYSIAHYALPSGKIVGTKTAGTAGSGGYVPAHDDGPIDGATLVHFLAGYVFLERSRSDAKIAAIREVLAKRFGQTDPELWRIPLYLVEQAEAIVDETPEERKARLELEFDLLVG